MANITAKIFENGVEVASYPIPEKVFSTGKRGFYVAIKNRKVPIGGAEFAGQIMLWLSVPKKTAQNAYVQ